MELDEFKAILYQRPGKLWMDDREVHIRNRSGSLLGKIKTSLRFELVFSGLFLFFTLYIMYRPLGFYIHLFAVLAAGFCFYAIYYLFAIYKRILHYQSNIYSVRGNLEQIITILERFNRQYFVVTIVMAPVFMIAAFLFANAAGDTDKYIFFSHYSKQKLFTYIAFSLAWYIALYFFTKWYVRQLYGQHLTGLKDQLKELDSD